jgi:hypothetical protein
MHQPTLGQTCPHCNGTTFCGASKDQHGSVTPGPSCATCKAKSGLDPQTRFENVICSVCEGKSVLPPQAPSTATGKPNMSWGWWGWKTPQARVLGAVVALLAIGSMVYDGYRAGGGSRRPGKEQMEQQIKEAFGSRSGVPAKSVRLVKESDDRYSGFVETQDGHTVPVKVKMDEERFIWETQPVVPEVRYGPK